MTDFCSQEIEKEIKKYLCCAERNVIIVVAWINISVFEEIFTKLINKGVVITILYNDDVINKRIAKYRTNTLHLIPIKMPSKMNKMHNKFCIIDYKYLITGSYNWSINARTNFENIMICDDYISIQKAYNEYLELQNVNLLFNDANERCLCPICNKKMIKLGVIENENVDNCEDRVDIFNICLFDSAHSFYGHLEKLVC